MPSLVRTAKVAVIEAGDAERPGVLPHGDRLEVAARLRQHLGAALTGS